LRGRAGRTHVRCAKRDHAEASLGHVGKICEKGARGDSALAVREDAEGAFGKEIGFAVGAFAAVILCAEYEAIEIGGEAFVEPRIGAAVSQRCVYAVVWREIFP